MLLATKLPIQTKLSATQPSSEGSSLNTGMASNVAIAGVAAPNAAVLSAPKIEMALR